MPNPQQPEQYSATSQGGAEGASRVDEMKNKAVEQVGQVRERARSSVDQQRTRVVERIRRVGHALNDAGQSLREEDEMLARLAADASNSVDRFARYVENADLRAAQRDVESYARRHPMPFYGGAFLVGLGIARFLKSPTEMRAQAAELGGRAKERARTATESARSSARSAVPWSESTSPEVQLTETQFVGGETRTP